MPDTQLAVQDKPLVKASTQLSVTLGIEPGMMIETIKAQCFKSVRADQVTDAQLAAYISVANALPGINPLLPGMLYAYPDKNGGITPIIGPDVIFTLLANNPDIVATRDGGAAWYTEHAIEDGEPVCIGYINHRGKGLLKKRIYINEWKVATNPNWNSRPRHMAEVRALKQCARQIIHGLPMDEDERKIAEMLNVTPTDGAPGQPPVERTDPGKLRRGKAGPSAANPPADPKAGAIDITPPPTDPTPTGEPRKEQTPPNVAAADAPPAGPARTKFVKDEKIAAEAKVVSSKYESFSGKHGAIVEVEGGFTGTLYDTSGGHVPEENAPGEPMPFYFPGKVIRFEAQAKQSKTLGLIVLVSKVSEVEEDVP